jgi:hypothetical protein
MATASGARAPLHPSWLINSLTKLKLMHHLDKAILWQRYHNCSLEDLNHSTRGNDRHRDLATFLKLRRFTVLMLYFWRLELRCSPLRRSVALPRRPAVAPSPRRLTARTFRCSVNLAALTLLALALTPVNCSRHRCGSQIVAGRSNRRALLYS